MGLIRTEAIVLRTVDFSESTQIAHFYSPTMGKFSAIARGVKRLKSRLGPRLEMGAQVEVSAYGREGAAMLSLSAIELLRRWPIVQQDLSAYALAALLIEAIDQGTQEARPSAEIYHLGVNFLHGVSVGAAGEPLAAHSLFRLICLLGYAPDLREPSGTLTQAKEYLFLNMDEGRLAPHPSEDLRLPQMRLSPSMRHFLRQSMWLRIDEFSSAQLPFDRPVLQFVIRLFEFHAEVQLKSVRFLQKMIWNKS